MPLPARSAGRIYDRIGRAQDTQGFYEDAATSRLAALGAIGLAGSVFELGCGTGRYAAALMREHLGPEARYLGVDVSPTMVRLARDRLRVWSPRARVELLEPPALVLPGPDREFDRFIATYVFDLLSSDHARALLAEAWRLLTPTGRLCLVSLTDGTTPGSRRVSATVGALASRWPALLGGCRPIQLRELLPGDRWRVEQREVLTRWCVPSEVLVAVRVGEPCDD